MLKRNYEKNKQFCQQRFASVTSRATVEKFTDNTIDFYDLCESHYLY